MPLCFGVTPSHTHGKWAAQIYYDGKNHCLGSAFKSDEAAARAFDAAAREHRGPNPAVNFPAPDSGETQAQKRKRGGGEQKSRKRRRK